jgi:serine/threonine-protein kinase
MGVMLYQLYSGRMPFQGETFAEILAKQIVDTPEPPSKHAPVPAELDRLIMRCLAKDPAARPQSAKELGQTLSSVLTGVAARIQKASGQPTSATTLSASAVEVRRAETEVATRKSSKRGLFIGAAVALAAAVIGIVALSGQGHAPPAPAPSAAAQPPVAAPPAAAIAAPAPPPVPAVAAPPAPAEAAPTTAAAEPGDKKRHGGAKPARRDEAPAAAPGPARPRSRASDTGLVTHNPFE